MVQLIVWGSNVAGNLTPVSDDQIYLDAPTIVERNREEQVETVIWTSWTCTIVKCVSGKHEIWGQTGLQSDNVLLEILNKGECARIIGDDQPRAILRNDGKVEVLDESIEPTISKKSYTDVIVTGLGSVFSVSDEGIFRFDSLTDLISNKDAMSISHPAIDLTKSMTLHAAESRVLLLLEGALPHLFELKRDQQSQISVNLIEDLEGLGVESVVAGSGTGNRLAVITEGGDGYIIPKGSIEVEPIELEDDSGVRLLALGSKFEVVVTGDNVWVRGDNGFSQLGMPSVSRRREDGDETTEIRNREKKEDQDEDFIKHSYFVDPTRIKAVHCGRWSTVVEMHDP